MRPDSLNLEYVADDLPPVSDVKGNRNDPSVAPQQCGILGVLDDLVEHGQHGPSDALAAHRRINGHAAKSPGRAILALIPIRIMLDRRAAYDNSMVYPGNMTCLRVGITWKNPLVARKFRSQNAMPKINDFFGKTGANDQFGVHGRGYAQGVTSWKMFPCAKFLLTDFRTHVLFPLCRESGIVKML